MYCRANALACVLLLAVTALAQNAPGTPETNLAGIEIHSTVADIQKLYGIQDAMLAIPPDPYPPGTKMYKWGRLTLTLKVLTEPSPTGEAIRVIQIEGEGERESHPISRTGRGLKLGDKPAAIKKIYGVAPSGDETKLQWSNGTVLVIHVGGSKERVDSLELRIPR